MKKGIAGSKESSDCLITVIESDQLNIEIKSTVGAFFYQQIKQVCLDTLVNLNINHLHVIVEDRGALDQTIKARLIIAIERMNQE